MQNKRVQVREEYCKQELLEIFKCLVCLLKESIEGGYFHKVYLHWQKFVLEIMSCMAKKSSDFLPPDIPADLTAAVRKSHLYTVGSIYHQSRSKYRKPDRVVPRIRLSGFWLEGYGFEVGKRFEVYPNQSQLALRVTDIVDSLPSGEVSNG